MLNDKIYQAIAANSDKLGTFGHGYTYSGHPVAAAVALETLRVIEDDCIVERCRDLAPAFAAALRQHAGRKHVGDVRAVGLMGALEFVVDKDSWGAFPADRKAGITVAQYALDEGLIVRPLGDTVALCPPLIIDATELDDLFERLGRAIDRFEADQAC